jgi:nitroimidazol reductase NimA-like FMN-containing flavoprotein (pyridoxamine 5'-phosphate oxidase superfamily)
MTETSAPTMEDLDIRASWALLTGHGFGRVAVTRRGQPEIYPVNYVVLQGRIRLRTAPGAKLLGMLLDDRVAFEVDGIEGDTAWSVLVKGTAEEVRLSPDRTTPPLLPDTPWVPSPRDAIVEITPIEVTGRRFRRAD